jgi:LmbE family N-acetylglucosaminyl deacetylase
MIDTPRRVLVVTPHPDDAEIGCAGVVARWVREGAEVVYLLCTNGDKGSSDPEMTSERLAAIREREQLDAARVLGVKEVVMLHHPDGELEDTREFRKEIVREIRRSRPDIVLCPDPFRRSYYLHRDHRITGQVTLDAIFPYARDHLHFPELLREGLRPHRVAMALMWGSDEPDTFIDIADTLELKIKALLCHRSQVEGHPNWSTGEFVRELARRQGARGGLLYGEAFRKIVFRA